MIEVDKEKTVAHDGGLYMTVQKFDNKTGNWSEVGIHRRRTKRPQHLCGRRPAHPEMPNTANKVVFNFTLGLAFFSGFYICLSSLAHHY